MNYDVIIVGGSLAGASAAVLLLREKPDLRVLIVERSEQFGRRVGEATVEVSAYFLSRVLNLAPHLHEQHIPKNGMRFWFTNEHVTQLDQSSEIGPLYQVRLPAWQLDRAVVDTEVLARAAALGAEVRRGATARKIELNPGSQQRVTIKRDGAEETHEARWVIDASGLAATLARQQGWRKINREHPTSACWARFRGVKDWDGRELAGRFPEWAARSYGMRNTATNHIVGRGWWSWWIPLKGGDVSVGVVFDQRIVRFDESDAPLGQRLVNFLRQHPAAREMLEHAEWVDGDVHWRKDLAYESEHMAGDGFVLVGDAAAFLDPFYSPGMDWLSFSVSSAAQCVLAERRGENFKAEIERHELEFTTSYRRWFEALYKDKYEAMGDYELMSIMFRLDLGLYYLGVVSQPFKYGARGFLQPPFASPRAVPVLALMRLYTRRLAAIARSRAERGVWGKKNHQQALLFMSFSISPRDITRIAGVVREWLFLELREGWRTWFSGGKKAAAAEVSSPLMAEKVTGESHAVLKM